MKYFTIKELSHSDTAVARGIDNYPTAEAIHNLIKLVENVLDPLREKAADITVGSKEENRKLFEIIWQELPFDQLIDEKDFSWVHVSFREGRNRKQVLKL